MSSSEPPRTAPLAPTQDAASVATDGTSETQLSTGTEEVKNNLPNPEFFETHVKACTAAIVERIRENATACTLLEKIRAVTTQESALYAPMTDLLTLISKEIFESFTAGAKASLNLPRDSPITFLNHHRFELAKFPVGRRPADKPDIVGVYGSIEEFASVRQADGTYRYMPYHCIETAVEAKPQGGDGKVQSMTYLYHVQQSRPDRPGMYGLSVNPVHFQVIYSCPLGLESSPHVNWADPSMLEKFCAYVYSLYDPPSGHILHDHTVTWEEPTTQPFGPATWTVTIAGEVYAGCVIIFVGNPWGRRTTVLRVQREGLPAVIIKESYLSSGRRYEEATLLEQIHGEGFVPGVVRAIISEEVRSCGQPIAFLNPDTQATVSKNRIVLADSGVDLEQARSVNDILMAMYDLLEVHRGIAQYRHVLHRDISLYNVLMYPISAYCDGGPWFKNFPALISDILEGKTRHDDQRVVQCMLIDLDNGARLASPLACDAALQKELQVRTGTPTYIARAVAARLIPCSPWTLEFSQMPVLSDHARRLYVTLHGEDRYKKYNDTPDTRHGGVAPTNIRVRDLPEHAERAAAMPFYHRWEYDAESVFWTLYSVLLRVFPKGCVLPECPKRRKALADDWKILRQHQIPSITRESYHDGRPQLIERRFPPFSEAFLPEMHGVASMLYEMAEHVLPSYALMTTPPPFDDHLHEAMQRIILEYLVAHRDDPIPLTPGVLRDTGDQHADEGGRQIGTFGSSLQTVSASSHTKNSSKHARDEDEQPQPQPKKARPAPRHVKKTALPNDLRPRSFDPPILKGEWKWQPSLRESASIPSTHRSTANEAPGSAPASNSP